MADKNRRVVQPPYRCNWCGDDLHDRYQKAIQTDYDGNNYCSWYCLKEKVNADRADAGEPLIED